VGIGTWLYCPGLSLSFAGKQVEVPHSEVFLPGGSCEYMAVVYNAKYEKETFPDLESQFALYKDGLEFF